MLAKHYKGWCKPCSVYIRCTIPGRMRPRSLVCPLCKGHCKPLLCKANVDAAGEVCTTLFTRGYMVLKVVTCKEQQ